VVKEAEEKGDSLLLHFGVEGVVFHGFDDLLYCAYASRYISLVTHEPMSCDTRTNAL